MQRKVPGGVFALRQTTAIAGFRFNTQGEFVSGGPMGDTGQTGRKLVCDAYGPRVPVGGGAVWGKDPWLGDRRGAAFAQGLAIEALGESIPRAVTLRVIMVAGRGIRAPAPCRVWPFTTVSTMRSPVRSE